MYWLSFVFHVFICTHKIFIISFCLYIKLCIVSDPDICSCVVGSRTALTPELKESLDKYLNDNKVVLFMKGNKMFPQCGFSNTCVQILNNLSVPYETVNILEDESLRQGMKEYSAWPTFPQLYIDGEFFGGCDITHGKQLAILTLYLDHNVDRKVSTLNSN